MTSNTEKIRYKHRDPQPWHYWHFRLANSWLWEAVLCIIGCLPSALISTFLLGARRTPQGDDQKCLQTLSSVPGVKSPSLRTTGIEDEGGAMSLLGKISLISWHLSKCKVKSE